ncbi:FAD-dependent monooxygenase [Rathayibacter soli]|uniref:FAD-dependent monooxygenase n=1 Tax=Rathayibacter soli TaxID=3144168 RepID=UPI0027E5AF82|nr:FAD-dependent monooxygenase [Glaciibacter superstes]
MQFHHHGYVSGEPRIQPAAGAGLNRPDELPDVMDVLIVGAGPAGHIAGAQLAQFPGVTTRLIERRGGRLALGHADGIQARSVETFQAFGFASEVMDEGYHITSMAFWGPDPEDPTHIVRTGMPADDPTGVSEFPHLIVNQARIQDYFAEAMANSPTRMKPDYGWEFVGLDIEGDSEEYPVTVRLRGTAGAQEGQQRTVSAKYVIGCDGARSAVRSAIGRTMTGDQSMHAWGVMDVLANTDFPDIRTKCAIQSHDGGNILLIPREGGFLFRMYVDLGEVDEHDNGAVRATSIDEIIAHANRILKPYTLDVRHVAWHSVYEVAHRLTDRFDDAREDDAREDDARDDDASDDDARGDGQRDDGGPGRSELPRVFITGDACHTHSAKAGQGMNVSLQDGFNIAWKLGHVLDGRSPAALLKTYSTERQVVAKELIDFDRTWSTLMATKPEDLANPDEVEKFYIKTFEFPAGFMTQYAPSLITGDATHQELATGFPVGKRFRSSPVVRVCDTYPLELGHQARADGRWRIYAFADGAAAGEASALTDFAEWLASAPDSPVTLTPAALDRDAWFDAKVIYQQRFDEVDITRVPTVFTPSVGQFQLVDREKVYAAGTGPGGTGSDIFDERGIDRAGAIVVVRPDMYVANVLPLTATAELAGFFAPILQREAVASD